MGCIESIFEQFILTSRENKEYIKIQGKEEIEPSINFYDITHNYDDL